LQADKKPWAEAETTDCHTDAGRVDTAELVEESQDAAIPKPQSRERKVSANTWCCCRKEGLTALMIRNACQKRLKKAEQQVPIEKADAELVITQHRLACFSEKHQQLFPNHHPRHDGWKARDALNTSPLYFKEVLINQ
jgi:hypothetical protein